MVAEANLLYQNRKDSSGLWDKLQEVVKQLEEPVNSGNLASMRAGGTQINFV